jgi:hypothetical protein
MPQNGNLYEYVFVYFDDLVAAMKDSKECVSILEWTYKFKTKGSKVLSFHLGMHLHCNDDGTLASHPSKYIEKMARKNIFGNQTKIGRTMSHLLFYCCKS